MLRFWKHKESATIENMDIFNKIRIAEHFIVRHYKKFSKNVLLSEIEDIPNLDWLSPYIHIMRDFLYADFVSSVVRRSEKALGWELLFGAGREG